VLLCKVREGGSLGWCRTCCDVGRRRHGAFLWNLREGEQESGDKLTLFF